MRQLVVGVTAVIILALGGPVWAQAPFSGAPQSPPVAYPGSYSYPLNAPTPEDAYRQGLLNRWELERLEGPLPPALQGPSPDGSKGGVEPP